MAMAMAMAGLVRQMRLVEVDQVLLNSDPQFALQADGAGFLKARALSSGAVENVKAEKVTCYPLLTAPSQSPLSNEKTPNRHTAIAMGTTRATQEVTITRWYGHLGGCFGSGE